MGRIIPQIMKYIEPHRIIIKGITFLAFNYSKTLFVGDLYDNQIISEKTFDRITDWDNEKDKKR